MWESNRLTKTLWAALLGFGLSVAAYAQIYEVVHAFRFADQPYGSLIQANDGYLYGTTSDGGTFGAGTVFRMDTSGLTTLHSFNSTDGANPQASLIQGTDGSLYGTTAYGGASSYPGYGTIFKLDTSGTTFTTLHSFISSDGANPYAGLIQATDGNFYGTTASGGGGGSGTVFKMDSAGNLTTLHEFAVGDGSDGGVPYASLVQGTDGNFYGTTAYGGGANSYGTVFKVDSAGNLTTLHTFAGSPSDGANPYAALIQAIDGNFYGTTLYGGGANYGTVFKMDSAGNLTTLHSFAGTDGAKPEAALIQATDGNFYGTTSNGGAGSVGTVFKMDSAGNLTTLHSFAGSDGANPYAALIQATDGNFYGTTWHGGASGYGTVFRLDSSGVFMSLHSFDGAERYPRPALIQATDGEFYGITLPYLIFVHPPPCYPSPCYVPKPGTVFKMDASGNVTTFHSPLDANAALIQATDGNFYGTGADTVFKLDSSGNLTTLHSFGGSYDGAYPVAALIQATDGNFYGTAIEGGTSNHGTVFVMDSSGTVVNALYSFNGTDGAYPEAALIQATDGNFYGTASDRGPLGGGVAFKISSSSLICFFDVPLFDPFYTFICIVARDGITAGCGGGNYCPQDSMTRAQMAVFLLKAEHGSAFTPDACTGIFSDVPCPGSPDFPYSDWIERLYIDGITGGCFTDPLRYCPDRTVTRAEMAVLLLKTEYGIGYQPPGCSGIFVDVPCPGSPDFPFSDWIEDIYYRGITAGCYVDPLRYCPDRDNSRGEMAVFLVKTFGLQ